MKLVDELTPPLRIKILVGDIFTYSIRGIYRYLRVISDVDAVGHGRVVLYFYEPTSSVMDQIPPLEKERLLLPPVITWREVLRDGFGARVLKSGEAGPCDRWPVHCFDAKGTAFGPYCDEFGKRLPERLEPCGSWGMPTSFRAIEVDLGKVLGLIESYDHYRQLPDLPRPLLRRARAGRLPTPQVQVVLPGVSYETFSELTAAPAGEDDRQVSAWKRSILQAIHKAIQTLPGFSKLAVQSYPTNLNANPPYMFMTVKKGQHEEFYRMIALGMEKLKIEQYYVQDANLHDWLAGTYRPAEHRPL
jgi:hypothetical protein